MPGGIGPPTRIWLKYKIWFENKTRFKYKTWFKYKNMGHSPCGPWPIWARAIWARAHMGQGPYGPRPTWAKAHMGQGPYGPLGPRPFLVGRTPHQKTHPGKKIPNCFFCVFFRNKKDAQRLYDHFGGGIAPRSLLCVRKRRFPFLKKAVIHQSHVFSAR